MKSLHLKAILMLASFALLSACVSTTTKEDIDRRGYHIVEKCTTFRFLAYENESCNKEVIGRYSRFLNIYP